MSYGDRGKGEWITVYAHGGHAYMVIAGLRFDTSGRGEEGPRWRLEPRSGRGFVKRHRRALGPGEPPAALHPGLAALDALAHLGAQPALVVEVVAPGAPRVVAEQPPRLGDREPARALLVRRPDLGCVVAVEAARQLIERQVPGDVR